MGLRVVDRRDFIPSVPQGKEWAERANRLPVHTLVYITRRDLSEEHLPVTNLNGLVTSLSSSSAILMRGYERLLYCNSTVLVVDCQYI